MNFLFIFSLLLSLAVLCVNAGGNQDLPTCCNLADKACCCLDKNGNSLRTKADHPIYGLDNCVDWKGCNPGFRC